MTLNLERRQKTALVPKCRAADKGTIIPPSRKLLPSPTRRSHLTCRGITSLFPLSHGNNASLHSGLCGAPDLCLVMILPMQVYGIWYMAYGKWQVAYGICHLAQRAHPGAQRPAQALTQFHRQLDPTTKSDREHGSHLVKSWIRSLSGQETPTRGQGRAVIYSMSGKLKRHQL